MTAARQKIIIDTDPGQDDAVAILLALASPELEVLGITVLAAALSNFFLVEMKPWEKLLCVAAALLLIAPGLNWALFQALAPVWVRTVLVIISDPSPVARTKNPCIGAIYRVTSWVPVLPVAELHTP